ncbi:TPA: serine protease [Candidatus Acetothermia bacterium]|nr:serine protease [Candidatus Acetothermia bacterium]
MMKKKRLYKSALAMLLFFMVVVSLWASSTPEGRAIYYFAVDGTINPASKDFILRVIDKATDAQAEMVIFHLNTPGGLVAATRAIVSAQLTSPIPIVVFVSPAGAQAASAGVFITMAADVAAMSPGTNIGAAHPVPLGGAEGEDVMAKKVVNDIAAWAKSIAEQRGRNVEWAEQAVRENTSITASEALTLGVVDLFATDKNDLLAQLEGYTLSDGRILQVAGLPLREIRPTWRERLFNYLADPNIVYILLMLGMLALTWEFMQPGIGFGAAVGGSMLLLAFFGLQILPINITGLALLGLGIVLIVLDIFTPTDGILTVGGVVALLFGSFALFDIPDPAIALSWWNILATVGTLTLVSVFVIGKSVAIQKKAVVTGPSGMVGAVGVVRADLDPVGMILVKGELWKAEIDMSDPSDEPIRKNERVEIKRVEGSKLIVRR